MHWKLKKQLKNRLAAESGAIKKDWGGKRSVCLVYPNTYRVGMGNLAIHSIYKILNDRDDIVCERAFLPDRNEIQDYLQGNVDLMSLESQETLSNFDVVAFSVSFENDYLNILPILNLAKLPFKKSDRNDSMPLIIAGGAAPTLNPKPISEIFDRIILGEFESYETDIPDLFLRGTRYEAPGTKKKHFEHLDDSKTQTVIYNEAVEFGKMHLIEVERGCPKGCKFCATPTLYKPFRIRSAECILKMVDDGLKFRKKFGLVGADLLAHPEFVEIATAIHARGGTFSPSSIRVDAIDETKAKLLATSKHKSIALGVEAGSETLRDTLGKKTSDAQILDATAILSKHGITRIRLYFMIGLPGEAASDIKAIASLSKKVLKCIRENAPKGEGSHMVDITISPFIPKPNTPFKNEKFAGEKYLKGTLKDLKALLKNEKGISLGHDSVLDAALENLLANGDEAIFDLLLSVFTSKDVRRALSAHSS